MQHHFGRKYGTNAAENYERFFVPSIGRPVADELMIAAGLRPEERVLDVACGTGVVARLAAERTGVAVAGLDLNPGMLEVAKSVTPEDLRIGWHESSVDSMPFPDEAFDVVLCQMSLQFFPDKLLALREVRRVLCTTGRLLLNTPGRMHWLFEIMDGALERHVGPQASGFLRAVFSLGDTHEIAALLTSAGFNDVDVQATTVGLDLPPPDEFLWQYLYATPLGEAISKMDDQSLGALERDVVDQAASFAKGGTPNSQQEMVTATARR